MSFDDVLRHIVVGGLSGLARASDAAQNWQAQVDKLHDPTVTSSRDIHDLQKRLEEYADALKSTGVSGEQLAAIEQERALAQTRADTAEQLEAQQAAMEMAAVAQFDSAFVGPQMDLAHRFASVYGQMANTNADAADEAARKILGGNIVLLEALAGTGASVSEGLEALHKLIKPEGIKDIAGRGGANFNMNGGQTFNIHQDYRDQDPDRVIVAFRRDLVKHAVARLDARTNTGFGGL